MNDHGEMRYDPHSKRLYCDRCGRCIQLKPEYRVLIPGDRTAQHIGSVGGLRVGEPEVSQGDDRLTVFAEFIETLEID